MGGRGEAVRVSVQVVVPLLILFKTYRSGFPVAKSLKKIKKNGHLTDFCTEDLKRL